MRTIRVFDFDHLCQYLYSVLSHGLQLVACSLVDCFTALQQWWSLHSIQTNRRCYSKTSVAPMKRSLTLDAHCCQIGTDIKQPVLPDWVKPSFVIFDIQALWRSAVISVWQHRMLYSCTLMAIVGVKGLTLIHVKIILWKILEFVMNCIEFSCPCWKTKSTVMKTLQALFGADCKNATQISAYLTPLN